MRNGHTAAWVTVAGVFMAPVASAHIELAGPAFAGTTYTGAFSVAHGCPNPEDASTKLDTDSVTVTIPSGVTARAVDSTLGTAVSTVVNGNITTITWAKNQSLPYDIDFYSLPVRMSLPNTPWTYIYFDAVQVCHDAVSDKDVTVDWVGTVDQTTALPDGAPPPEPAPKLFLLPARTPGWNKYTVTSDVTALKSIFGDAEIVWAGNAAYSINPNYAALIGTEPNTTQLTTIPANTEIWVKY